MLHFLTKKLRFMLVTTENLSPNIHFPTVRVFHALTNILTIRVLNLKCKLSDVLL